jgi:hypothetical protein
VRHMRGRPSGDSSGLRQRQLPLSKRQPQLALRHSNFTPFPFTSFAHSAHVNAPQVYYRPSPAPRLRRWCADRRRFSTPDVARPRVRLRISCVACGASLEDAFAVVSEFRGRRGDGLIQRSLAEEHRGGAPRVRAESAADAHFLHALRGATCDLEGIVAKRLSEPHGPETQ